MALSLTFLLTSMVAAGGPTDAQPLTIGDSARSIEQAELALRVETETWDGASQSWVYQRRPSIVLSLDIRVDERSGEDGALAPSLYFNLPANAPAHLKGFVLDEEHHTAEAWYGNDAPALVKNRLEFLSEPNQESVRLRWSAQTEEGQTLHFEGPVDFMGLSLKVKNVADVSDFLKKTWPELDGERLELISESEIDYGDEMDEDRRHWMEIHYDLS